MAARENTRNGIITALMRNSKAPARVQHHEGDEQNEGEADTVLPHRKHRHIGGVAGLELACLAIEHADPFASAPSDALG